MRLINPRPRRATHLLSLALTWLLVLVVTLSCSISLKSNDTLEQTQTAMVVQQTDVAATVTAQQSTIDAQNAESTRKAQQPPPDVGATQAANNLQLTMAAQPSPGPSMGGGSVSSYSTEFDNADDWKYSTVPETDAIQAYTNQSKLYLEVQPELHNLYALYNGTLPMDVQISTYAQKVMGPNTNNISLVCRATDAGWYEFSMTSGGYWYIWMYPGSGDYVLLAKGATLAINLKNRPNKLSADCAGSTLTFYINDQQVGSVDDRTFMNGGQVGIGIYSEYPGLGVEFDWFTASGL